MKWLLLVPAIVMQIAFASVDQARAQDDAAMRAGIDALADGGFNERQVAIDEIVATGDMRVAPVLQALADGLLLQRKSDGQVFIGEKDGRNFFLFDALSGAAAGEAKRREVAKVRVNNKLRRAISAALGGLQLRSNDPGVRRTAADAVFKSGDPAAIPALDAAIAEETEAAILDALKQARAAAVLNSDADEDAKLAAVDAIAERGNREALDWLIRARDASDGALKGAATRAIADIERSLAVWDAAQNVWYGLSLGSVLLLAAIGLAITFGVMGVINMAHGELVMLGAYTTFVVQEVFRQSFPGAFDYSLFVAVPAAFLVSGAVGIAMERGVIRYLYGRPLETLLATWGISLVLQQSVRTIFGPTNREVGTPSWMSGSVELTSGLVLTSNRIAIIVFAALVFILLTVIIRRTTFGLQMRAVTQNRPMANSVGIRSNWVDALTFGLGSAIAGIAGVALSQIDNVSPNLGQSYIIDSFLVVVFGGVGNLWGTLVGAMSLGILNKFLEPYAGAVLGKILILVLVILFIQKRPRGLFALKGRAVEA